MRKETRCRQLARGAVRALGACALAASSIALAQPPSCEGDAGRRAQSARYTVPYRFDPQLAVGSHFALLFTVCRRGAPAAPESVSVYARKPAHGHGMNYQPSIAALGGGSYRADGLMLHMPGRWELVFVVREGGRVERIVHALELQ
jgi:hypothetical protein